MNNVRYLVSAILIIFGSFFLHTTVYALEQDEVATGSPQIQSSATGPINITISPVTISLKTRPNVPITAELKVRNNGVETEYLRTSFTSFVPDETGEKPILKDPSEYDTFLNWMSVNESSFSISPGEWKTLTLTFAPPSDAALSYYYALLFERENPSSKTGETVVLGAPAILILTTVEAPQAKIELSVLSFTASTFLEFLPQTFLVQIKNTGNIHVMPKGNIFIDGQGKKDLAILSLNPSGLSVLPNTTRTFRVVWNQGFPTTSFDEHSLGIRTRSLLWNLEHVTQFRYGQYKAHLLMVYDNGQRDIPIESQLSFWVIPWKLFLLFAFLFILSLIGAKTMFVSVVHTIWNLRKKYLQ